MNGESSMEAYLLPCVKQMKSESERRSDESNSLRPRGLYSPWDSPGQGIFPTQGLNPGLLHYR